ncbi:splicing factor Cactin-like [Acropora muricata]|uniref:cactin-like n=1 Tax=Acropora millepora TaxID=45264 RepID=UPI001CF5DB58|nr:cactin-like [Acropora millepora]XP_029202326.2 cactin-like [Acropora millepora]
MPGGDRERRRHRSRSRSRSPQRKRKSRSRSRSPRRNHRDERSPPRSKQTSEKKIVIDKEEEKRRKKKEKELLKSLETPEEKRARRLAKKEAKDRKKRKEMGWDDEYLGYTNTDNPFGDAHLLENFVWQKKREKDGEQHLKEEETRRLLKIRQQEAKRELEKVKRRRIEREHEKQMREDERELLQREKEANSFKEWADQEDKFHLEQAKLRSKIRIQDGRAKPIDLLAQYVSVEDDDLEVQMHEPYKILVGLTIDDLEDLLVDIKVYMELEEGKNATFWKDITTVCNDELQELKKEDPRYSDLMDRRESINGSVKKDIVGILGSKTYSQLVTMQKQINSKISSGDAVDIGYWETLLQQLTTFMARARLKEFHQAMLRKKLDDLKKQKSEMADQSTSEIPLVDSEQESESESQPGDVNTKEKEKEEENTPEEKAEEAEEGEESVYTEQDLVEEGYAAYDAGNYSPRLLKFSDVQEGLVVDPSEDLEQLQMLRQEVLSGGTADVDKSVVVAGMVASEASKGMGPDEESFNVTVPVTQKVYLWADKYRPRKPRFFNRVHTGYEWNKYNQTHYDSDNPPPKIVQGYKFNIFYPDLVNKSEAPEYFLEDSPGDSKDFALLRFHAGPPYEDIAFKIVNREWEYSHRHGFRCQFQNNIFQLWFHFKRYRYRR